MSDEIAHASAKDVKIGRYMLIDGIPCKVIDIETSSPGKHGSAKMRITGIGIFDGQKKTLLQTSHGDVDVPVITKKKTQVVSVSGDNVQLMDAETYEVFELRAPEEFKGRLAAGAEVEVIEAMGRKAISRVLSG